MQKVIFILFLFLGLYFTGCGTENPVEQTENPVSTENVAMTTVRLAAIVNSTLVIDFDSIEYSRQDEMLFFHFRGCGTAMVEVNLGKNIESFRIVPTWRR